MQFNSGMCTGSEYKTLIINNTKNMREKLRLSDRMYRLYTRKSVGNLVTSNKNQIVFIIFRFRFDLVRFPKDTAFFNILFYHKYLEKLT